MQIERFLRVLPLVAALPACAQTPAVDRPDQPVELGAVTWQRDIEAALAESKQSQKPVLLLFQEVPG